MGGFGSGRHEWSFRDTVEACRLVLAIQAWVERGLVRPGHAFGQIWTNEDGTPAASIHVEIALVNPVHPAFAPLLSDCSPVPDRLQAVLRYRAGRTPEDMRDVEDLIVLAWSRRGFGGQSLRFYCPGCGRRVADLYRDGFYFRCRKCCGLGYQSQRETRVSRGLEKAARIKKELGGTGDYAEPFPEKPKGMQWRTYERLLKEAEEGVRPYLERLNKRYFGAGWSS